MIDRQRQRKNNKARKREKDKEKIIERENLKNLSRMIKGEIKNEREKGRRMLRIE